MLPIQSTPLTSISQTEKQAPAEQDNREVEESFENVMMHDGAPNGDDVTQKADHESHDMDASSDDESIEVVADEASAEIDEDILSRAAEEDLPEDSAQNAISFESEVPITKGNLVLENQSEIAVQRVKSEQTIGDVHAVSDDHAGRLVQTSADQRALLSGLGGNEGGERTLRLTGHSNEQNSSTMMSAEAAEKPQKASKIIQNLLPQTDASVIRKTETATNVGTTPQTNSMIVSSAAQNLQPAVKPPDNLSLEGFEAPADVRVRRIEAATAEIPSARAPTHPVQAMLHAQMATVIQPSIVRTVIDTGKEAINGLGEITFGSDGALDLKTSQANQLQPTMRAETPVPVTRQIADAMRVLRNGGNLIEVALSPAELGNVRMTMAASDTGMTVAILADRPETLELLRRNIADLNQSFSEMGYEDISFSFDQNPSDASDGFADSSTQDDTLPRSSDIDVVATPPQHTLAPLTLGASGVDIRL